MIDLPALRKLTGQVTAIQQAAAVIVVPVGIVEPAEAALEQLRQLADDAEANLHAAKLDGWGDKAAADLTSGKLKWSGLIQLCAAAEGVGLDRAEQVVQRAAEMIAETVNLRTSHDWIAAFRDAVTPLAAEAAQIAAEVEKSGKSIGPHSRDAAGEGRYHRARQWLFKWRDLHDHAERFRGVSLLDPAPSEPRQEFEWEHPELVYPVRHPDDEVSSYISGVLSGAELTVGTAGDIRRRRREGAA